jgi:hypothetical protein
MQVRLLHTDVRVIPTYPVELLVAVDDVVLRAEVEWATVESWLGPEHVNAEAVDEFVRLHRHGIERAIAAHLFAHGIPLAHRIAMDARDFYDLAKAGSAPLAEAPGAATLPPH